MTRKERRRRIFVFARLFLGIFRDFYKETRLACKYGVSTARKRMSARHRKRAIQLRKTALEMGGVLIKLGQFFSSRADVMPEEYIEELVKLQDMVPAVPFEEVKQLIQEQFGRPLEKVFKSFDPQAAAAASLAQVHYAQLPDGTPVAVKIQRPSIEHLINIDLATFSFLMEGVDRFTSFGKKVDIPMILNEFNRTLGDELDFIREGYNAEQFRENFKDNEIIYIPKVYWEFSSKKVLTLEKIEGVKINDYATLKKRGIDRSVVAQEVAQSYFKQVLEDGFFHADPHPGNLFVVEGPEITFVDFGMVGLISPLMKDNLRSLVIAIAGRDVDGIVNAFISLGFLRKGVGSFSVKNAIRWMLDNYSSITTNTLSVADIEEINEDLKRIMRDEPFTIPAEFAFLARAFGTLHGLAVGLDPNFDAIEAAAPYVKKLAQDEKKNLPQLILKEVADILKILAAMPRKVDELLSMAQKGNLKVKIDSHDIVKSLDRLGNNQKSTAISIVSSVLFVLSVFLLNQGFKDESYVLFALGFALVIYILFNGRRKKRRFF